jgi:hypothetical protein
VQITLYLLQHYGYRKIDNYALGEGNLTLGVELLRNLPFTQEWLLFFMVSASSVVELAAFYSGAGSFLQ